MSELQGAHGVNLSKPRKIFWDIVNGRVLPKNDIYTRIAFFIAFEINLDILINMRKVDNFYKGLNNSWFKYLNKNIFRIYSIKFSSGVLEKIMGFFPVSDELSSLFLEIISSRPEPLYNIAIKDGDLVDFIKEYKARYGPYYAIFEKYVQFLGREIGRIENKTINKLDQIFQLYRGNGNPAQRAPVGYQPDLNKIIIYIIHIKNAIISHGNYKLIPPNKVEIWDKNSIGEEKFRYTFPKTILYDHLYILINLIRGLQRTALYYSFVHHIAEEIVSKTVKIRCYYCNAQKTYVITPNKKRVKCKNCKNKIELQ